MRFDENFLGRAMDLPQWIHVYPDCHLCPDRPNPIFYSTHPMAISNPSTHHGLCCPAIVHPLVSTIQTILHISICQSFWSTNCPSLVAPIVFSVASLLVFHPEIEFVISSFSSEWGIVVVLTTFGGFGESNKMLPMLMSLPACANATNFNATNNPDLSRKPRPFGSDRSHIW